MKKHPLQKAEEYLRKAKDILDSIPVDKELDDGSFTFLSDVKNVKRAGRMAWKGCSIALNYALEECIDTYDYYTFEKGTKEISHGLYCVFDIAYCILVYSMSCDGTHDKEICNVGIARGEQLVELCRNRQSLVKQHEEEEKRAREERLKNEKEDRKTYARIAIKQKKELFEFMLGKANLKKKDIFEVACNNWIAKNLDLLTEEEKKRFDHLVFPLKD